jgi:hypothetical protein
VIVSVAAAPIRRRLSFAVTALGALVVSGLAVTAMALLGSYPAALVLWAASSGFGLLLNINTGSLRQAIVPSRLSGSVADVYAAAGTLTALIALSFAFSPVSRGDRYLTEAASAKAASVAMAEAGPGTAKAVITPRSAHSGFGDSLVQHRGSRLNRRSSAGRDDRLATSCDQRWPTVASGNRRSVRPADPLRAHR